MCQEASVSESDLDDTAARSAFFNRLAANWSQAHYGPQGGMVSRIARFVDALESLVPASASILDYGCGTGADVTHYRNLGLDAEGYDIHQPFGYADLPRRQFRVVTLIFVLNVLPTARERLEVLRRAASFLAPAGLLVVAARSTSAIRAAARTGPL